MGETLFLTDEELTTLTGARIARKRIAILRRERIPFSLDADGKPVVRRDYNVNRRREFSLGEVS